MLFTNSYPSTNILKYHIFNNKNNRLVVPLELTQDNNNANFCYLNKTEDIIVFTKTGLYYIEYIYTLSSSVFDPTDKSVPISPQATATFTTNIEIQRQQPIEQLVIIPKTNIEKLIKYNKTSENQNITHLCSGMTEPIPARSNLQVINYVNNLSGITANNGIIISFLTNSFEGDEFISSSNTLLTIVRGSSLIQYSLGPNEVVSSTSFKNFLITDYYRIGKYVYDEYFTMDKSDIHIKQNCKLNFYLPIYCKYTDYTYEFISYLYIIINDIPYILQKFTAKSGQTLNFNVLYNLNVKTKDIIKFYILTEYIGQTKPTIVFDTGDISILPL